MNFDEMKLVGELECFAMDGSIRVFEVRMHETPTLGKLSWDFWVRPRTPPDDSGEFFFATFTEINAGLAQATDRHNHLPDMYRRCGISRALIPRVASLLRRTVRSSFPEKGNEIETRADGLILRVATVEESLSPSGKYTWEEMLSKDKTAVFDSALGRYFCAPGQMTF